jgi:uncharacterized protein YndB with AHSA1/START domain
MAESPARVALHRSAEIPANADEVWELICDWAGMMRWWPAAEAGALPGPALVSCELVGRAGSVPRTRRMTLGNGTVAEETVVYQNDQARRLTYIKSDDRSVSGYVATTYVDSDEGGGCTVHVVSMFDVSDLAARAAAAGRFEAVYAAMFGGYRRYFARNPA